MRVLVIRFSSLGDIICTTPVVRALFMQLGAEVHYVTKREFAQVLEVNPFISRVWVLDGSLYGLARDLGKYRWDAIVDLHSVPRSFMLSAVLKGRIYRTRKQAFMRRLIVFAGPKWSVPHVVYRHFSGVKGLGVQYDGLGYDVFINRRWIEEVRDMLLDRVVRHGFILVAPWARHNTKSLPLHLLQEVICFVSRYMPVVVSGPAVKRAEVDRIVSMLRSAPVNPVINLCGCTTVGQLLALVYLARAVISVDTSVMHIAAGLHKDLLVIWGGTHAALGMYPLFSRYFYGLHVNMENTSLSCRPCHPHGRQDCPEGHWHCLNKLPFSKMQLFISRVVSKSNGIEKLHSSQLN